MSGGRCFCMRDEGEDSFELGGDVELVDGFVNCNTPCPNGLYFCGGDTAADVYVASKQGGG